MIDDSSDDGRFQGSSSFTWAAEQLSLAYTGIQELPECTDLQKRRKKEGLKRVEKLAIEVQFLFRVQEPLVRRDGFEAESLGLLQRAVERAEADPHFAHRFVEEAAVFVRHSKVLRDAYNAVAARSPGAPPLLTRHEKKFLVDSYYFFRRVKKLPPVNAYAQLRKTWPNPRNVSLDSEHLQQGLSRFKRELRAAGVLLLEDAALLNEVEAKTDADFKRHLAAQRELLINEGVRAIGDKALRS